MEAYGEADSRSSQTAPAIGEVQTAIDRAEPKEAELGKQRQLSIVHQALLGGP